MMDLSHLNPIQREAVLKTEGPVMILAGAGSGKTRTLVSRIQYLIDDKQVSPFRLLALTFSNKAAKEMRERVASESKLDFGTLQITTFHSFCARLLRSEANLLGLSRNFTIYDTSETKSIIKTILGRRGINQKEIHPNEVAQYIDSVKNLGYYLNCEDQDVLDEIDQDDLFHDFFKDYEIELHKSNAVDFGGLITGTINLFENFPEALERYQKRYHYLLVDEYQDTNRAQFKLIKMLSSLKKNICVVGDEDQSIYSWRGADIRNILEFEKIFPNAQMIKLEQNYRSSKNIIEAASCVISKNEQRKGKEMWTDNDRGDHIDIIECPDDRVEAEFIAKETRKIIAKGVDPTEIAIFYRTNAQSRILEDALRKSKIAYRVVAGIKFYERKEVKDLLSYLRCIVNDKDSLALSRVINVPVRGIGAITLRKIEDEAIKSDSSLWQMINLIVDDFEKYKFLRLSKKIKNGLRDFVSLIHEAKVLSDNNSLPSQIYEKILHESLYYQTLEGEKTYEAQGRLENLDELMSGIKQYEETEENPNLVGFLETITLDSGSSEDSEDEKQVSMMTTHGSKGLEYHYVFVAGCEETVFPSFQSMDDEQGLEEERRLFYVAMTRAMKKLYICFAEARMLWGSIRFNAPSRFIDEIPEDFYSWKSQKKKSSFSQESSKSAKKGDFDFSDEFSQESNFSDNEISYVTNVETIYKFPLDCKVEHKLYGFGKIISVEGKGQDEKVVIQFKEGAKKKFLVKFAPITKI